MRSVFFYTACIALLIGILIRSFFDFGISGIVLMLFLGIVHGGLWYVSKNVTARGTFFLCMSVGFLVCALGMTRLEMEERQISSLSAHAGQKVSLYGSVIKEPDIRETLIHVYVEPTEENLQGEHVLVTLDRFAYQDAGFSYGDQVRIDGVLSLPKSFETDTGRMFDYSGYLKARGVRYVIAHGEAILEHKSERSFRGILFAWKATFQETLERVIPEPYVGLGEGVLLGVKRAIGKDLEKAFRDTGVIHIVVLSGYNIMIVVECILFLLSFFFFPRMRLILGCVGVWTFALLVGLSATVVRASLMATLLLVARSTGRIYVVLRALMITAILMVLHNPYILVHDPGFQLSFLATLGLILLMPYIEERLTRIPESLGIRGVLAATIAAQIFVLPLLLYHTGLFSVVSVLVNVLVLPMVPVAMLLTFLTGIIGTFSQTAGIVVGFIAYLSLGYIITIVKWFGALPFVSFSLGVFPFWLVMLMYVILAVILIFLHRRNSETNDNDMQLLQNNYEGWVIEEEKETSPESLRDSGEVKTPLPFR